MKKKRNETIDKPECEVLQQKSWDAVGAIRKLIQDLRDVNERAGQVKTENTEKIESIKAENAALDKMISGNLKVADNFEKLLG